MIFEPILDFFRGKAVTIPPLDGAFRPNTALDEARVHTAIPEPDNLVYFRNQLAMSSGNTVYALHEGRVPSLPEVFPAPISALAVSPAGELAIALDNGDLYYAGRKIALPPELRCITAIAFGKDGMMWLTNGSANLKPSEWARDLMGKGATGSVWISAPGDPGFAEVASGLAFPYGVLAVEGGVIVSESWRHRLLRIDGVNGAVSVATARLPGYPSRLTPASDGGAWLSIFAPMNRLIEFVLQEDQYRAAMVAEIPPSQWIAPSLSSGRSFLEPLQCGGIRMMGVHKPWSPSRSYGLVVRLDAQMRPVASYHSRANGQRHGVTSALEVDGLLYVAAKGGDAVLALELDGPGVH